MDIYKIVFFGHRDIENPFDVEDCLEGFIKLLLYNHEYIEFRVGINGEFDMCAARAVKRTKRKYRDDNSRLILVLPYMTTGYRKYPKDYENYYDEIEISDLAANAHPKAAIEIRNREMVDNADMIICYVTKNYGGAYNTVKYAKQKEKFTANISQLMQQDI